MDTHALRHFLSQELGRREGEDGLLFGAIHPHVRVVGVPRGRAAVPSHVSVKDGLLRRWESEGVALLFFVAVARGSSPDCRSLGGIPVHKMRQLALRKGGGAKEAPGAPVSDAPATLQLARFHLDPNLRLDPSLCIQEDSRSSLSVHLFEDARARPPAFRLYASAPDGPAETPSILRALTTRAEVLSALAGGRRAPEHRDRQERRMLALRVDELSAEDDALSFDLARRGIPDVDRRRWEGTERALAELRAEVLVGLDERGTLNALDLDSFAIEEVASSEGSCARAAEHFRSCFHDMPTPRRWFRADPLRFAHCVARPETLLDGGWCFLCYGHLRLWGWRDALDSSLATPRTTAIPSQGVREALAAFSSANADAFNVAPRLPDIEDLFESGRALPPCVARISGRLRDRGQLHRATRFEYGRFLVDLGYGVDSVREHLRRRTRSTVSDERFRAKYESTLARGKASAAASSSRGEGSPTWSYGCVQMGTRDFRKVPSDKKLCPYADRETAERDCTALLRERAPGRVRGVVRHPVQFTRAVLLGA